MNFFEKELRNLLEADYPDATFIGRQCYIPLGDQVRARVQFQASSIASHYDTIGIKVLDRSQGEIDRITLNLTDLLGIKKSTSPYLKEGVAPHIWDDHGKADWYGFKPSEQDRYMMTSAISDYIQVFREPEQEQSHAMGLSM